MPIKMPVATLRDLCSSQSYSGADDVAAMQKWAGDKFALEHEGKPVPVAEIEFSDEKPALKTISIAPKVEPKNNGLPDDWSEKTAALVAKALKDAGVVKTDGRPPAGDPNAEVKVGKSMVQKLYENDIKRGVSFFSDYDTALLAKSFLTMQVTQADMGTVGMQQVQNAHKSFLELHEKIVGKAYSTTSVTGGAALMPEAFIPDLIRNVTEAGVARRLSRVITMTEGSVVIPRRTGGVTIYFPLESGTITESSPTTDNVQLHAKTALGMSEMSNQALADSGVSLVDFTMQEFATAIAQKEDDCLLVANGEATNGGMTGFESTSYFGVAATDGGNVVVGGTTADAHTAAQLAAAIARVPAYARKNMAFTGSTTLCSLIFHRLQVSTPGGLTLGELEGFGLIQRWLGIPIIENNSMSTVNAASTTQRGKGFNSNTQIDLFLGDFSRAAIFGDRMQVSVETSREAGFKTYSTFMRIAERFHTVVHSIGTSSVAGPVVSFWQS